VHDYANVYFDAHNPTLSRLRDRNHMLAVVRLSTAILDLPGAFIATKNAACTGVEFHRSPDGLTHLDAALVYAEFWTDPDEAVKREKGYTKCAELLVPDRIDPAHILGAYVASEKGRSAFTAIETRLAAIIKPGLFFGAF
jgi:hypothetical protein